MENELNFKLTCICANELLLLFPVKRGHLIVDRLWGEVEFCENMLVDVLTACLIRGFYVLVVFFFFPLFFFFFFCF